MSVDKTMILYGAISIVTIFSVAMYVTDIALSKFKPDFIKINGKIDKNKQFIYGISISFMIMIILILFAFQIYA